MLIIIVIILTTIFVNSHEKYIDLLPDEKKQEFLQKVARRIIESVESNSTYWKSKEFTDEQLKKHNSYVQSVIDQEAEAFEDQSNNGDDITSEEDSYSKDNEESDEFLGVKPLKFRDDDDGDDAYKLDSSEENNIDLAVTGNNRRSYDEIPLDNFTDNSKTDSVTEDTVPLQTEPATSNVDSLQATEASLIENLTETEDESNQGNSNINSETEIHKPKSTTEIKDLKTEDLTNTSTTAYKNITQYEATSETIVPLPVTAINSKHEIKSPSDITRESKLNYDSATDSNIIYVFTESNDKHAVNYSEHNSNASKVRDVSEKAFTSLLTDETTTNPVMESITNEITITETQKPEYELKDHAHDNDSTVISSESNSKTTDSNILENSDSTLPGESTTDSVTDTYEQAVHVTQEADDIESDVRAPENDFTVNNSQSSLNATESYTQDSSDSAKIDESTTFSGINSQEITDSALTDESTNNSAIETTTNENAIQGTQETEIDTENNSTVNSYESISKDTESNIQDNSNTTLKDENTTLSVTDTYEKAIQVARKTEFESEVHLPENYSTENNSESSLKATELYTQGSANSSLTDESTTDLTIDTTASESTIQVPETQEPEFESEVHDPENDSTVNHFELTSKTTEYNTQETSDSATTGEITTYSELHTQESTDSTLADESTTESDINTINNESAIELTRRPEYELKVQANETNSTVNSSDFMSNDTVTNLQENSQSTLTDENTTYPVTDTYENAIQVAQEAEFESKSEIHVPENYSTVKNSLSSSKATESYTQDSTDRALADVSTADSETDTISNENAIQVTQKSVFPSEIHAPENYSSNNNSESSLKAFEFYTQDSTNSAPTAKSPVFKSRAHVPQNYSTGNKSESSSTATAFYTQRSTDSALIDESTTESVTTMTTKESAIQVTQGPKNELKVKTHENDSTVNSSESSLKDAESNIQENSQNALTDESTTYSVTDTYDNAIRVAKEIEFKSETEVQVPENYSKVRNSQLISNVTESHTRDSTDNVLADESATDSVTETTSNENTTQVSQRPVFKPKVHLTENDSTANNFELTSNATDFYIQESTNSPITDEITTESVTNTVTNEIDIQVTQRPEYEMKIQTHENDSIVNSSESSLKDTESNTQENSQSALTDESTTYTVTDTYDNSIQVAQETEFESESEVHLPENYSTVENFQSISNSTESHTQDSTDSALTNESATDSVTDTTSNENITQVSQRPVFKPEFHVTENDSTANSLELTSKATEFYIQESTNSPIIDEITTESVTNTVTDEIDIQVTQGLKYEMKVQTHENDSTVNSSESSLKNAESNTQENSQSALTDESTTYTVTDTYDNSIQVAQETEFESESEVHVPENYSTVKNFQSISSATKSHTQDSTDNVLTDESMTESVTNTVTNESAIQVTQNPEYELKVQTHENDPTANSSESYSKDTESSTEKNIQSALTDESITSSVTDIYDNAIGATQETKFESEVHVPDFVPTVNNSQLSSKATESYTQDSATDSVTVTTSNENAIQVTKIPIFKLRIHVPENYSTDNNSESSSKATEFYIKDGINNTLRKKSRTDSNIDTTTNENAIQMSPEPKFKSEVNVSNDDSTVTNLELTSKATEFYSHDSIDSALIDQSTTESVMYILTTNKNAIQITQRPGLESVVHVPEKSSTDTNSEWSSKHTEFNIQNNSVNPLRDKNTTSVTDTYGNAFQMAEETKFESGVYAPEMYSTAKYSEMNSNATDTYIKDSIDSALTHSVIDTTTNKSAIQSTKKIELEWDAQVSQIYFTGNNTESSSNTTESNIQVNIDSAVTDESTDSITDTTTNESTIQDTQLPETESEVQTAKNDSAGNNYESILQAIKSYTQDSTNNTQTKTTTQYTAENYTVVTEDLSAKWFVDYTITETTVEEQNTEEPKNVTLFNTTKQTNNDDLVSFIATRALQNVKHELERTDRHDNKEDTYMDRHRIYENPWLTRRNNQPISRTLELNKDQRYYVPVYRYSPNFVYYNSKNRLGPSEVAKNSVEKINIYDRAEARAFILQLKNDLRKFITTEKKKHTTTPIPEIPFWLQDHFKTDEKLFYAPSGHQCEIGENCDPTSTIAEQNIKTSVKKHEKKHTTKTEILSVVDETDVFTTLEKLQTLKIPLKRSNAESKVSIYISVLKDLILANSKSLKQYDWLTTTVQIQSALTKILRLIKRMKQSEPIHPADLQILKYIVFLHNLSLEMKKDNNLGNTLEKRMKLLPCNKKKRKSKWRKKKRIIDTFWLYLRTLLPDLVESDELSQLYEFLINIRDGLFDFHVAIRHIAEVTKFDRQNWYDNLKQLYLSADEKHLRELLLHISMSRLVDLVEQSCKKGLDYDFIHFVETNNKDAARILEEIVFINDIVHEIALSRYEVVIQ